jgi:hypothetical protein
MHRTKTVPKSLRLRQTGATKADRANPELARMMHRNK